MEFRRFPSKRRPSAPPCRSTRGGVSHRLSSVPSWIVLPPKSGANPRPLLPWGLSAEPLSVKRRKRLEYHRWLMWSFSIAPNLPYNTLPVINDRSIHLPIHNPSPSRRLNMGKRRVMCDCVSCLLHDLPTLIIILIFTIPYIVNVSFHLHHSRHQTICIL